MEKTFFASILAANVVGMLQKNGLFVNTSLLLLLRVSHPSSSSEPKKQFF